MNEGEVFLLHKEAACAREYVLRTIKSTNGTDKFQPLQCCVCPIYYKCVTTSYHQPLPPPLTPAKLWENRYSHSQFSVLMLLTQQSLQGAEGRYCECYDPWSVPKSAALSGHISLQPKVHHQDNQSVYSS